MKQNYLQIRIKLSQNRLDPAPHLRLRILDIAMEKYLKSSLIFVS
jgi:hypothetical protein